MGTEFKRVTESSAVGIEAIHRIRRRVPQVQVDEQAKPGNKR